jgi:hypothetical protein
LARLAWPPKPIASSRPPFPPDAALKRAEPPSSAGKRNEPRASAWGPRRLAAQAGAPPRENPRGGLSRQPFRLPLFLFPRGIPATKKPALDRRPSRLLCRSGFQSIQLSRPSRLRGHPCFAAAQPSAKILKTSFHPARESLESAGKLPCSPGESLPRDAETPGRLLAGQSPRLVPASRENRAPPGVRQLKSWPASKRP